MQSRRGYAHQNHTPIPRKTNKLVLNGVWIFLRVRFPATWNKIGCGKKDENADENVDKNTDEKKPTELLVFLKESANTEEPVNKIV